jgi:hypothetical protein
LKKIHHKKMLSEYLKWKSAFLVNMRPWVQTSLMPSPKNYWIIPHCTDEPVNLFIHLLKDILVASKFGQLQIKLLKTSYPGFHGAICFQLNWWIPDSAIAGFYGKSILVFWEILK